MSNQALTWARKSRGLTATQKLVLFVLADAADEKTSQCWNAAASLAEETGLSDRSVRTALHDLIEAGAISGIMRSGVRPLWTLAVVDGGTIFTEKRNRLPVSKRNQLPTNRKQLPFDNRKQLPLNRKQFPTKAETASVEPETVSDEPSRTLNEPTRTLTIIEGGAASSDAFEDWWQHYPRKVGKDAARAAYAAARKRGATEADLAAGLRRQRWPADPQFVPHARTWLTQGRWQDDPRAASPADPQESKLGWMLQQ